MKDQIYLKKVELNSKRHFDVEKIDNDGAVIIDEMNDKIHFLNSTAAIIYEEIKGDALLNVFNRYKSKIFHYYSAASELDIKNSFEEFFEMLLEYEIVVFVE